MTDTSDQSGSTEEHHADLDVEAEKEHLDELGHRIDDARYRATEDLEPGHAGRTFADSGTERSLAGYEKAKDEGDDSAS